MCLLFFTIIIFIFLNASFPSIGIRVANTLLVSRDNPRKADIILVLGGEVEPRVAKAIDLYRKGFSHKLLVTGKKDGVFIAKKLADEGVPKSDILLETLSESTFENASLSLPVLRRCNANSVLLVTSWFHSKRAKAVFSNVARDITFISTPTDTITVDGKSASINLSPHVILEYFKLCWYWFNYGISPLS